MGGSEAVIRLIITILLLLVSLLCLFPAPTYKLWLTSIAAGEYSWMFVIATVAIIIWSSFSVDYKLINLTLGVIALVIFSSPVFQAWKIGKTLPPDLEASFGKSQGSKEGNAFSFLTMIGSLNGPKAPFKTLSYSKFDGDNLTLDFYQSLKGRSSPCVIVVHGGSWSSGDSQQLPELNARLTEIGFNVASISYRLAPKYISPAPVEDIRNAMEYLRSRASELNVDTTNFFLLGRSAGSQIAMMAAYTLNDPNIRGVVDIYGPADMVWGYSIPSSPLIMDSRKVMEDYLGGTYDSVPQNYVASSPVEAVNRTSVPTLIIHGKNDPLVAYKHSIRLQKKLTDNNIPHYFLSLPWATHGCDYTITGPSGQLTTYAIEYFLTRVLATQPSNF